MATSFKSALVRNQRRNRWRKRLAALRLRVFDFQDIGQGERFDRVVARIEAFLDENRGIVPPDFALQSAPARQHVPATFPNNTRLDGKPMAQKVLFSGSRQCLPGQGDLF